MSVSNENKDKFLGMSHGKAAGILRKKIMFYLLQKLGEDTCFKCSNKITIVEDLSIEHKIPWLNNSVDLFWDIDNIAFSHLTCNISDNSGKFKKGRTSIPINKNIGPEGTSWCYNHKEFLPIESFTKDISKWNGFSNICIPCRKEYRSPRSYSG